MLELPAYQWTAPRTAGSIYRAPEIDGDPMEILTRYQRLLDEPPPLPSEIAASDRATLDALLANTPKAEPASAWMGGIGSLTSVPVVIDAELAPGRVELRDRDGNVTRALYLAGSQWIDMSSLPGDGGMPGPVADRQAPPKTYQCARCGRLNPDYLAFETGWPKRIRYWCLGHIPRWTRIKMRLRGTT
jgi:hypothetical protein